MNLCQLFHLDNQMAIPYFLVVLCSPLSLCLVDPGLPTKVTIIITKDIIIV